jgi:hypothetical protein
VYNDLCEKAFGAGAKLEAYHLQMYGVVPERQRQGIGRELVKVVEDKVCSLISIVFILTISHRQEPSKWTCAWKT